MKLLWLLVGPLALALAGVGHPLSSASTEAGQRASYASYADVEAPFGWFWRLHGFQAVVPGTVIVAGDRRSHGTRSDEQFFEISRTGSNDVPEAALRAYRRAEKAMAAENPGCAISWTLLAAIGRVESNHGRFGGAQLGADGVSRPEIRGPRLDGAGPFAAIADSDNGTLDRDKLWDRAVGQMQFLPQTWASVARDGDGDGVENPDDIDDSALGSAVYLCGAGGSLANEAGMARAAFRYNHSDYYVKLVLSFQAGYATGVFAEPSPPPPAVEKSAPVKATRPAQVAKPRTPAPTATPKPTPATQPKPSPRPTPKPTPTPTPTGPRLVQVDGVWRACGTGFCLGSTPLDLGGPSALASRAATDYDGDGTTETNAEEFTGLVDRQVTLQVERSGAGLVVFVIGADGLRNADGSFARALLAQDAVER